jgi:hypothetical protein
VEEIMSAGRVFWIAFAVLLAGALGWAMHDGAAWRLKAKESSQELIAYQLDAENDPINKAREMSGLRWSFFFLVEGQICKIQPGPPKGEIVLVGCVPEHPAVPRQRPLET